MLSYHPSLLCYLNGTLHSVNELNALNSTVEEIIVDSITCNDEFLTVLNLTRFGDLRVLAVGNECFRYVKEVILIELNQLERVMIGENCFTSDLLRGNKSRHFYLKNCERVRELKIGCWSFSDYSVCEIENVPSLEVIEIGDMDEKSFDFYHASLELKSDSRRIN